MAEQKNDMKIAGLSSFIAETSPNFSACKISGTSLPPRHSLPPLPLNAPRKQTDGSPPIPANDKERLEVLRSLGVLDTAPEPDYDALAQLAAQICDVPIALVSLVDSERQWFKAVVGIDSCETSRESSFCAHAINTPEEVFIVPNALLDRRFANNPLVIGAPNIRFYAGAPLVTHDGWAVGTLCVIDSKPRVLYKTQLESLLSLRRHVVNALELRRVVSQQNRIIAELERTRRSLDDARRVAEEATRTQAEFLATMSHEIRTPMNAVIGMTTILRDTALSSEQLECVETIQASGDHLLCVVNDILDFSKIEAGKLDIEHVAFSLSECLAASIRLLSVRAMEKKLKITQEIAPNTPDAILGDITRLRQILVNLLSNAVKFTEAGEVHVSVSAQPGKESEPDSCELFFRVRDTGIGIPPDRVCRLFQRFFQVDTSTTRQYGGTGLGLVISQRLAELQGGKMWVESEPGLGSTFHFTVKVKINRTPVAPAHFSPRLNQFDPEFAACFPARILVVEDNPVNRKVVGRMLEKLGYKPNFANNGLIALDCLQQATYDLVLMDVEMPEMDGPTASRRIRSDFPAGSQPIVVALTAHAVAGVREALLLSGMDDMLTKPIRLPELTGLLKRYPLLRQGTC